MPWCLLQIQTSKKKTGVIPPKKFVQRLKRDNELFRSYMHQVHHEHLGQQLPGDVRTCVTPQVV
jgi:hypothetical protein